MFEALPAMHGEALATVEIRRSNADFRVFEIPPCAPDGEGEHIWVHVRKTGCNTDWVAEQLARLVGVKARDVSYAGRKDRHAICEQWFSVHLPGLETPNIVSDSDEFEVLSQSRHSRKLRTGGLKGNRFEITMRPTVGEFLASELKQRLEDIEARGVPNYFGEQRFGNQMSNIRQVERWVAGGSLPRSKNRRSMIISAARSWIFNQVVAGRMRKNRIDQLVKGDYCRVTGRHSGFEVDDVTPSQIEQLASNEIEIAAPMVGDGLSADYTSDYTSDYLDEIAESYVPQWHEKLKGIRVSTDWRSVLLKPANLNGNSNNDGSATISFELPPGAFATAVIREIAKVTTSDQS